MKLTRWHLEMRRGEGEMILEAIKQNTGRWVEYSDVSSLESQLAALKSKLETACVVLQNIDAMPIDGNSAYGLALALRGIKSLAGTTLEALSKKGTE